MDKFFNFLGVFGFAGTSFFVLLAFGMYIFRFVSKVIA